MTMLEVQSSEGWITVDLSGVVEDTSFQILAGDCRITVEDPSGETDFGFKRSANDVLSTWSISGGKTVRIRTDGFCQICYEVL